ncbi:MAG: DHHA1 domain-containing protein [Planctomycetota bacterium]|nr:DHHA1 domain-containing protein [Planctomycetota bacterium]
MCASYVNNDFQTIVERLGSSGTFLVLTHARPDGDGLGTIAAMASAGRCAGKIVHMLVPDTVPPRYEFLFSGGLPAGADEFEKLADESDLIVVVDTCAFAQLDGLETGLHARREKVVVIDHHATADNVGSVRWLDTSASAVGVMVAEVIEALGWSVDTCAAEALMTAIATDTGWFRFSNTDPRTLRAAAKMLERGARADLLYAKIYLSDRPERLRLLERMLASLELHCRDRLAVMTVRRSDFNETGARADETEDLVNEALRLKSVEVVVLLVEEPDCVRASLRSREIVDVSSVAARFGGGGHARAAGLRTDEEMEILKKRLIETCSAELDSANR